MPLIKVTLLSRPEFLGDRFALGARDDQLRGTDAEQLIELAGRTCYDSLGKGRSSDEYHKHIVDVGHGSVLEHAQFTFLISGVSRACINELVRHRVGVAISQRSTRYVDESEADWITHPALRDYFGDVSVLTGNKIRVKAAIQAAIQAARNAYEVVVEELEPHLEANGCDRSTARKQARGAARLYLGNGIETELVWSANVRALLHIFALRGHPSADGEIRELATAIWDCVRDEAVYFKDIIQAFGSDGSPELNGVKSV